MLYTMYLVCFRGKEICRCACFDLCDVLVAVFNCTDGVSSSISRLSSHSIFVTVCRYQTMLLSILTMADISSWGISIERYTPHIQSVITVLQPKSCSVTKLVLFRSIAPANDRYPVSDCPTSSQPCMFRLEYPHKTTLHMDTHCG